ncbi:MAG: tyrosine/phenylalanine carboxypeptidase domain-containing protein [Elusimicrobiota bacterium]
MNHDKKFYLIKKKLSFYTHLLPLNRHEEKQKFLESETYNPIFKYSINLENVKEALKFARSPGKEDKTPVASFYRRLKQETVLKAKLLFNIEDNRKYNTLVEQIFGSHSLEDKKLAFKILAQSEDENLSEKVSASKLKKEIEEELNNEKLFNWKIRLKKNMNSKMNLVAAKNMININSCAAFFPHEIYRLIIHEIRVHLYRALNGERQKWSIFKTGTAAYSEAEEGLAVYFENHLGFCPRQQMKIYAGRLLAVDCALDASFRHTFNYLRKWFNPEFSYRFTERAKRGMIDTAMPGSFRKEAYYISGYRKIEKIKKEKDFPGTLFSGKIALDEISETREMIKRGEILPPKYLPHGNF